MVDFFIEENNIEIKNYNYNYKELSNFKIDSLFLNKIENYDQNIFSLILYKENYICYVLENYKKYLIDIIYEKENVSHINSKLKLNEKELNKFCIFFNRT